MSRLKGSGSRSQLNDNDHAIQAIWHSTVDNLRVLSPSGPDGGDTSDVTQLQREKNALDTAIDQLSLLIRLRKGETIPAELIPSIVASGTGGASSSSAAAAASSSASVATSGGSAGQLKRKRRTSASYSASPAPVDTHSAGSGPRASPAPGSALPSAVAGSSAAVAAATAGSYAAGGAGRSSTPAGRETTKTRKDQFSDQLPLRPGRKVAFKVPKAGASTTAVETDDSEQEWILAIVKRCLNGDRMRYEVVDADDATDQAPSYNTTLRSLIPLPDATAPVTSSAHPSNQEEYPRGSTVFAQYPETTSFYRATVVAAPLPQPGAGSKSASAAAKPDPGAVKGMYRLAFVDDEDRLMDVHKDLVVKPPKTVQ